ncbi:hypothetical protein GTQ40_08200 [Flavobacteriaceae bacterium R38]|nr:hypothetical protein [Flavobacteriaceae bacterium R38]
MNGIVISNVTNKDKEPIDYHRNIEFKKFAIGSSSSTLVPLYKELLFSVIGDRINTFFQDYILSREEMFKMKDVFEEKIKSELESRDSSKIEGFARRIIFEKEYRLDLRLNPNNDRMIEDMHNIYLITKEGLEKNKPIYLSID